MGTKSTLLTQQWQLIGSTPMDIETTTTSRVYVMVSDTPPQDSDRGGHLLGQNGVKSRTFDAVSSSVYARTDEDLEVYIVSVPRSDIGKLISDLKQSSLLLDRNTMDVYTEGS